MNAATPLQILMIEDSAPDAGLIEHALRNGGIEFTARRVQTEAGFRAALAEQDPQIVLADYNVPGFRGDTALAAVLGLAPERPVIFVSGTIGEERAVELMRAGATDYVLKDRLERLPFAVRRALEEKEQREARRRADEALRESHDQLEQRVGERTEELRAAVDAIEREIAERQRLEREILEISEREQNRLGQDLHDDLGQQLAGISLLSRVVFDRLAAESHEQAPSAETVTDLLQHAVAAARDLAHNFYPVELENYGLFTALEELANRTEKLAKIRCRVVCDETFHYEKSAAIHLYRIVQESIGNAIKHGKAANIVIQCTALDGPPTLTVRDDGTGFIKPQGKYGGMGLRLFDYRARLIGAEIRVTKGRKRGCVVQCTLSGNGSGQ